MMEEEIVNIKIIYQKNKQTKSLQKKKKDKLYLQTELTKRKKGCVTYLYVQFFSLNNKLKF